MAENKLASPKSILIFVIILLVVIASLSVTSYLSSIKKPSPVAVQPTEEPTAKLTVTPAITSKLTPTPTPQVERDANGWIIIRDEENGYEIKYPNENTLKSITVESVNYTNFPSNCPINNKVDPENFGGKKITINNIPYCEYTAASGAAGTTVESFTYTTVKDKKLYTISFNDIGFANCENYVEDLTGKKQCEDYNKSQSKVIDDVLLTFKFI